MQRIFTHINQVNLWESIESASGRGSELATTVAIRTVVLELLAQFGINSILDAPCGDFNWMRHIPLNGITYTGIDVVSEMIEKNQVNYGNATIQFMTGDITKDSLPQADLIICRDCLVHLPLRDGCLALRQFQQSGSRYLLTTTYPATTQNRDAAVGSWKPLNLCLPPFSLPTPLMIFSDPSDDTGANPDKSIGLWDLQKMILPTIPHWSSPQVMLTTFVRRHFNPAWKL